MYEAHIQPAFKLRKIIVEPNVQIIITWFSCQVVLQTTYVLCEKMNVLDSENMDIQSKMSITSDGHDSPNF